MRIAVAADHAGFQLKQQLAERLRGQGHEVLDLGTDSEASTDYPAYAHHVARAVADGEAERGVLVCGSGIGMCMAANRTPGVRAAVLQSDFDAEMSRRHNDANVACFGARQSEAGSVEALLDRFLETPFEGGRHERRVRKIDNA